MSMKRSSPLRAPDANAPGSIAVQLAQARAEAQHQLHALEFIEHFLQDTSDRIFRRRRHRRDLRREPLIAPQAIVTKSMGKMGGAEGSEVVRIIGASISGCARKIARNISPNPTMS